jgi:hypothetical protein
MQRNLQTIRASVASLPAEPRVIRVLVESVKSGRQARDNAQAALNRQQWEESKGGA